MCALRDGLDRHVVRMSMTVLPPLVRIEGAVSIASTASDVTAQTLGITVTSVKMKSNYATPIHVFITRHASIHQVLSHVIAHRLVSGEICVTLTLMNAGRLHANTMELV